MGKVRENHYLQYHHTNNDNSNNTSTCSILYDSLIQLPCAQEIINILSYYSQYDIHFLYSEEMMSRGGERSYHYYTAYDIYPSKLNYISLSILLSKYYHISIIVTYRYYYQWLISAKQQQEKYYKERYHWNVWPSTNNNHMFPYNNKSINKNYHEKVAGLNRRPLRNHNSRSRSYAYGIDGGNLHNGHSMEPLFPYYYKYIQPGIIYHNNNPDLITDIRTNNTNNIPDELYWANTIGIPYYYTDYIYTSLLYQQKLLYTLYCPYNSNNNTMTTVTTATNASIDTTNDRISPLFNVILFNLHTASSVTNDTKSTTASSSSASPLTTLSTEGHVMNSSSLRTLFLCQALPNAHHICNYSQMMEHEHHSTKISASDGIHYANPSNQYYSMYDQLVVSAYQKGLLVSSSPLGRHHIVMKVQKYHQSLIHNLSASSYDYHFPLICPNHNELELFLNQSLQYETYIINNMTLSLSLYQRHHEIMLDNNNNMKQQQQHHHMNEFWYDANVKKKFCNIDTNQTLQQKHWIDFFHNIIQESSKNRTSTDKEINDMTE